MYLARVARRCDYLLLHQLKKKEEKKKTVNAVSDIPAVNEISGIN